MSVEAMYQEIILDHYREKHHTGLRAPFDAEVHHVNPSCGDELTLRLTLDDDTVSDVSYEGVGCSISQASTSVMTDLVIGHRLSHGLELHDQFLRMMQSRGAIEPDEETFGDAIAFAGVSKFPARVKCALLGWSAFRDAALRASTTLAEEAEQQAEAPAAVPRAAQVRTSAAPATGLPADAIAGAANIVAGSANVARGKEQ